MPRLAPHILPLVAILAIVGCAQPRARGGGPPAAEQPQSRPPGPERTIAIVVRSEPRSIAAVSPGAGGIPPSFSLRPFNAFLDRVDDRGAARPYLAEALPELNSDTWQVFPDGRMETRYTLKPNLWWHDGTPLSSDDFAFAWRVYSASDSGFGLAGSPPLNQMEEVTAPDDRRLVIRWRRPYPGAGVLPVGGPNYGLPALPRHVLAAPFRSGSPDAVANHPYWTLEFVGLGPFRLARWELGSSIEATAFDGHVLGRPKIDRLRLMFIADNNAALTSIRSGTAHVVADIAITFQQGLHLKREWAPTNGGTLLWTTGAWRSVLVQFRPDVVSPRAILDLRVRRALAHAIDKQALNEILWGGEGIMTDTIFAPSLDYYSAIDRTVAKYPFDLRASERLMNEAGFAKGAGSFYTSPIEGRFSPELKSAAGGDSDTERSILASAWRQAGFDLQEAVLPAALQQDGQARAAFPALYAVSQSATESNLTAAFTTGRIPRPDTRWNGDNHGGWSTAEYDSVVEAFNRTLDPSERIQQRIRIAKLLTEELPVIALYYQLAPVAHVAAVRGPVPVSLGTSGYASWNIHEWELV